jgi:hypothetical protein
MAKKYYQEADGDFLVIETRARVRHHPLGRTDLVEGWCARFVGEPRSVRGLYIPDHFLKKCTPVARTQVPQEWLSRLSRA